MFADRLKYLRKSKKITQAQLASEIGVATSSVGTWEGNARDQIPEANTLIKIADYFNVTVDYLLEHEVKAPLSINNELNNVYLIIAREAQENNISVGDIELVIDTIKRIRNMN